MIADKPLNVNHDFAKGVLLGFLLPFCSFACLFRSKAGMIGCGLGLLIWLTLVFLIFQLYVGALITFVIIFPYYFLLWKPYHKLNSYEPDPVVLCLTCNCGC